MHPTCTRADHGETALQLATHGASVVIAARWLGQAPHRRPINIVHEWVLHIETPAGEPVEGASVTVDRDMPAHGHGMPTQPQVTADLGWGDNRVEGMSFQMGGYWIIDVSVTALGETDLIRLGREP